MSSLWESNEYRVQRTWRWIRNWQILQGEEKGFFSARIADLKFQSRRQELRRRSTDLKMSYSWIRGEDKNEPPKYCIFLRDCKNKSIPARSMKTNKQESTAKRRSDFLRNFTLTPSPFFHHDLVKRRSIKDTKNTVALGLRTKDERRITYRNMALEKLPI